MGAGVGLVPSPYHLVLAGGVALAVYSETCRNKNPALGNRTAFGVGFAAVVVKWVADMITALLDGGMAYVDMALDSAMGLIDQFGLGGLLGPAMSFLKDNVRGLREWLKKSGKVGYVVLAIAAAYLILIFK